MTMLHTYWINFFSRAAKGIYSKFATNIPYEVPTKYCYFSSWSEIQYGPPDLWLTNTFWTSQERLKGSTPKLPQMLLMRSRPSIVTFQVNPKSNNSFIRRWFLCYIKICPHRVWPCMTPGTSFEQSWISLP